MSRWFDPLLFQDHKATSHCEPFAVVLACSGEKDLLICCKCGKAWLEPCRHHVHHNVDDNRKI